MSKIRELFKKRAEADPGTKMILDASQADFFESMTQESFALWAKQLEISADMPEFNELKEIVEEIRGKALE